MLVACFLLGFYGLQSEKQFRSIARPGEHIGYRRGAQGKSNRFHICFRGGFGFARKRERKTNVLRLRVGIPSANAKLAKHAHRKHNKK